MIQKEPIWRTMWGQCFSHKSAIFWPFSGKGDYGIHPELWNLAWIIPGPTTMIQEELIQRTRLGPCFGHKRALFWLFLGLLIHWVVKWKTRHSCRPLVLFEYDFMSLISKFLSMMDELLYSISKLAYILSVIISVISTICLLIIILSILWYPCHQYLGLVSAKKLKLWQADQNQPQTLSKIR